MLAVESIGSSLCNGVQESVNFNFNSNNIGNSLNGFGNGGGSLNFGVNGGNNNNLDTFNAQSNGFNFNIDGNSQFETNCDNVSNAHNAGLWTLAKIIAWTFPGEHFI